MKYVGLFALGGVQGLIGWIMVKSGLDHKMFEKNNTIPRVSQYRLAIHFATAVGLYSTFLWMSFNRFQPKKFGPFFYASPMFRALAYGTTGLTFLTAFSGAFVAGLDAGLIYNEWPTMGSKFMPDDAYILSPFWKNFFEHDTSVQFNHRVLAYTTLTSIAMLYLLSKGLRLPQQTSRRVKLLSFVGLCQVTLGIWTLLSFVPTPLAATHQAGAMTLMTVALWFLHSLKRIPKYKLIPAVFV